MIATMADHVVAIAQDLFAAMVDGVPGLVDEWAGEDIVLVDPVHAWVDVRSAEPVRALLTTERTTAERIARGLLETGPDEDLTLDDLRDAFGEMANVIGGNLKGLMPQSGALSIPGVVRGPSGMAGDPAWERRLQWRAEPLIISMWNLEPTLDERGPLS